MPASTSGIGASGVISSKTTNSVPLAWRGDQTFGQTEFQHHRIVTSSIFDGERTDGPCPASTDPGPTSSVGCGSGTSRTAIPAARFKPGSA
jgi:hypothetical protein